MWNIVVGILVSMFIYYLFVDNCIYHGPDSNIIKKKIYYDGQTYYRLKPKICISKKNKITM